MILRLGALYCLALVALGQTTGSATLLGSVKDSTGAVVADAKVTVKSVERSFVYEGRTNISGDYYIPHLPPGTYEVSVEAAGFKTYVRRGITLRMDEMPRANITLEVGSVSEAITVTAAPPLLETETAGAGQVLEAAVVQEVPVMQKMIHRVMLYMPGITTVNGNHVLGQRQRAIGLTLDGVSGKEPVVGQANDLYRSMVVSLDSIQEFKLWTTGMPAEFGHSGGGVLSTVFRSGTNRFHGLIEDRYINLKMIHRHYFQAIRPEGGFFDNPVHEWGGMAGGPIRKDRTFFFVGFQHHYNSLRETFIGDVPSAQMYEGNFDFGPGTYPIYDPESTRLNASNQWIRDPFPQNRVPESRFDPAARKLTAEQPWRQANSPGILTPGGPQQNLVIEAPASYNIGRYDIKVDHQFSSMHKLFGRYSHMLHRSKGRPTREVTELVFGRNIMEPSDFRNIVLSDSYTLSPTMINELRIGFNRRHHTREPESYNQDWAGRLGIPNVSPETFPDFRNRNGGAYFGLGPGGRFGRVAEDISLQNNFTKIAARHTIKAGYELIRTRYNSTREALPSGQYRMGGTEYPFRSNTGQFFADLLLGTVSRADFTRNSATWLPRWWHHAWYLQESWKARPNLSLEFGVRWSYESPYQTKWGQQSQFDPQAVDAISGLKGAVTHPKGLLARRDLNNFQPRLGISWNFRPKWVFRSSFGLVTVDLLTNEIDQNFEEYVATAVVQSLPGDPRTVFRLSEGPLSLTYPINADGSVPFRGENYSGRSVSWYDPAMRMPYIMNWSGSFQYQFGSKWLVEALYQGTSGVGLLNSWDMNSIPLNISTDPVELDRIFRLTQNYKPWPQFGQVLHFSNYGHSSYHGGTWRVEKRYSSGVTLNAFYTLSKAINEADSDGEASGVTFYNRRLEKARASYDTTHRFVSIFLAELPFGNGRRWMNVGGWRNAVLGGWDLGWTQTLQSGPPVTITHAGSPFNYLPGARRPDAVPGRAGRVEDWQIGPHRFPFSAQNRYFNFDAFAYPAAFHPGTLGRNTFEAPGLNWAQTMLSKTFPIGERMKFVLRWDWNNPTKQPQFANPNSAFNLRNTANFGTFSSTRGSISDVGTSRAHHTTVGRFEW